MSLPRKGSRNIIVDGMLYSWIASGNDDFIQLVICTAKGKGQKLLANFGYYSERDDNGVLRQRFVITPGIVKQVIEYGLKTGWTPGEKKVDLNLLRLDDKIELGIDQSDNYESNTSILRFETSHSE